MSKELCVGNTQSFPDNDPIDRLVRTLKNPKEDSMTNAEHLIENAIFAMKYGRETDAEMETWYNKKMLEESGISKNDIIAMACHVVYSLYDGKFPT